MSFEKPNLPQKNELPLNIKESRAIAKGHESTVWGVEAENKEGIKQVVLKETREQKFATEEEMQESKKFYEYLKNFPGFGKFVPDSLYFKARESADKNPQAYVLQHFMEGKTINKVSDEELYKDPALVHQLQEFIDASIAILQEARRSKKIKPDFHKSYGSDLRAVVLSNFLFDPRYSDNIFITDEPDKNGQRIFFIDTGANKDERTIKAIELMERYLIGNVQELQLKSWKKKVERMVSSQNK